MIQLSFHSQYEPEIDPRMTSRGFNLKNSIYVFSFLSNRANGIKMIGYLIKGPIASLR
jgi:hypothetical protein